MSIASSSAVLLSFLPMRGSPGEGVQRLSQPGGLSLAVSATTLGAVDLDWEPVSNATGYRVEYVENVINPNAATWQTLAQVTVNGVTSLAGDVLTAGYERNYRVVATAQGWEDSEPSTSLATSYSPSALSFTVSRQWDSENSAGYFDVVAVFPGPLHRIQIQWSGDMGGGNSAWQDEADYSGNGQAFVFFPPVSPEQFIGTTTWRVRGLVAGASGAYYPTEWTEVSGV